MNSFKVSLCLLALLMLGVTACNDSNDEDLQGQLKYYLLIQSQVSLNLDDDDESQGTMAGSQADVMSTTISRMKQAIVEAENQHNGANKDAAIISTCDNIYKEYEDYASHHDQDKGQTICFVKIMRSKVINGVTHDGTALKSYYFYAFKDADPGESPVPTPPSFSLEKPDTLQAIDLGLSVLWANCNMGADSPEDYGGYFAWGDPTGALWSADGINYSGGGYGWESSGYSWNTENYGGKNPPTQIGGTELDVVAVHWSDGWRTPSLAEAYELCSQCQWLLRDTDGRKFYEVIGPNGNRIIIPLAGLYGDDTHSSTRFMEGPLRASQTGYYWTSTICDNPGDAANRGYAVKQGVATAWTFICASSRGDLTGKNLFNDHLRAFHMSIRPIHDK